MLIGQYTSKLTDKNRLAIPAKLRSELGDNLIIAKWYEQCLVLVSRQNWQDLINRLGGESKLIISPIRDIDRFIYGSAFEITTDDQGRFVLPESLIDYADLSGEVVFIGLRDRVELWPSDRWKDLETQAESKASEAIEKLAKES